MHRVKIRTKILSSKTWQELKTVIFQEMNEKKIVDYLLTV